MLDRLGPDQAKMMPRETVIEKLRARGEPIRLFGEDNQATFFRLRKMELGRDENYKIMGWTNEIKSAMDQVLSFLNPYEESDQLFGLLNSLKMAERSEAKRANQSFASKKKN